MWCIIFPKLFIMGSLHHFWHSDWCSVYKAGSRIRCNARTHTHASEITATKLFIMGSLHHSECHLGTQIDAVCTRQALGSDVMHAHTHTHTPVKLLQQTGLKPHAKVHTYMFFTITIMHKFNCNCNLTLDNLQTDFFKTTIPVALWICRIHRKIQLVKLLPTNSSETTR